MAFEDDEIPEPVRKAVEEVLNATYRCSERPVGAVAIIIFPKGYGIVPIIDSSATVGGGVDPGRALLEDALAALTRTLEEGSSVEPQSGDSN